MKHKIIKYLLAAFAILPGLTATLFIQNCGGAGGPIGGGGGDGGGYEQQFWALLSDEQKTATYVGSEACSNDACHTGARSSLTLTDLGRGSNRGARHSSHYQDWLATKHAQVDVGCERCHGPGSKHVASPSKTNILTFPGAISSYVCAQCHGSTFEEWEASAHSELVETPINSAINNPSGQKNTWCIVCHSALVRTSISEKGIDFSTLPNETIVELAQTTLDDFPYTATCVVCHDPHRVTGNLTWEGKEVQLRHLVFNTDTSQIGPGTTPPQFTQFNHICAECHNGRGTDPSDAALQKNTTRPSMHDSNQFNMLMGIGGVDNGNVGEVTAHATAPGQCSHCHMGNSRHTFTVSYDTGCAPCHTAADAAARASALKDEMIYKTYALKTRLENWAQATFGDSNAWEYSANGGYSDQSQIPIEVKRARHNYYFVIRDASWAIHNSAYARLLIIVANENMDALGPKASASKKMPSKDAMLRSLLEDLAKARRADEIERD